MTSVSPALSSPLNNGELWRVIKNMMGIYKITNQINGKAYIGQSVNIIERWRNHRSRCYQPSCKDYEKPLYRSIRKYGLENFSFEILEECDEFNLNDREIFWIKQYHTNDPKFGYNLTSGGDAAPDIQKKFLEEEILEIKNLLLSGETQMSIANKFNVSQTTISYINLGKEYFHKDWSYPLRSNKKGFYCLDCGVKIYKGAIRCRKCEIAFRRLNTSYIPIEREDLKRRIKNETFEKIGKDFGKSGNAVRKWCKKFNLPSTKEEIIKISDEEWVKI